MGAAGILGEDDRVELIAGEIVEMAAIGLKHANCVRAWIQLLRRIVPDEFFIDVQNPIKIRDDGEPQPDIALLHDRTYTATPTAADVLFVVEVSDSSLAYDRGTKLPLYAAAGIAEAWLVDLSAGIIERHTEPYDGAYRRVVFARAGETLTSTTVPAVVVPVEAILH